MQVRFIIGVAITCTTITVLLFLAWKSPASTWLALIGAAIVLAFELIRAASFDHIDRFIGNRIPGFKWNWVLEMGGISIVLTASWWRRLLIVASFFGLLREVAIPDPKFSVKYQVMHRQGV